MKSLLIPVSAQRAELPGKLYLTELLRYSNKKALPVQYGIRMIFYHTFKGST